MNTPKHMGEPVTPAGLPPDGVDANADADIRGSWAAIRRAAQRARQVAQQTGTDLIVVRAGQVVRVAPQRKADQ